MCWVCGGVAICSNDDEGNYNILVFLEVDENKPLVMAFCN